METHTQPQRKHTFSQYSCASDDSHEYKPESTDVARNIKQDPLVAQCEKNIARAIRNSPFIRLMLAGLKEAGCTVTPHRHLVCEAACSPEVSGGYDQKTNQVVICSNICVTPQKVEEILAHELVHLYDFCTTNLDLTRSDHLACTEIRAANLAHCKNQLYDTFSHQQWTSHTDCVKHKAASSVRVIKGVPQSEALKIVENVFSKCYKDLEPIGRVTKDRSDACRAFSDYQHFSRLLRKETLTN